MNIQNKLLETIKSSINELNLQRKDNKRVNDSIDTKLFGSLGSLDSLGLVNFLVILEQKIEDEFDVSITIADERAMSQKHSPFRTISTLANYIDMLLKEI